MSQTPALLAVFLMLGFQAFPGDILLERGALVLAGLALVVWVIEVWARFSRRP